MKQRLHEYFDKTVWMFRFVRPYKVLWALGLLFGFIGDGLGMFFAAKGIEAFGECMLDPSFRRLIVPLEYYVVCYLSRLVFNILFQLTYGKASAGIRAGLKGAVYYKYLKRPIGNTASNKTEDQMTHLNQDIDLCMNLFTTDLMTLFKSVMMGILTIAVILNRNIILGIFCTIMFLGNIIGNLYYTPKQEAVVMKRQQEVTRLNGIYNDLFAGAMVIKLLSLKPAMTKRVDEAAASVSDIKREERKLTFRQERCTNFFLYAGDILPLLLGVIFWVLDKITFGTIMFIYQMSSENLFYCSNLGGAIINLSKCQAGIGRIYDMLQEEDEVNAYGVLVTKNESKHVIELNQVNVSYGTKTIIQDFSLQVQPNETIAFVGSSGSGKSTIMKAILQLISYQGEMKFYGEDAKKYSLEYLRNQIAYVEQEAQLFDGTIYDNIAYGNVTATEDEVYAAAKKAYAADFILNLPNGYDTIIGENGYKLSGGERQRVAIARAFLKNAPILLLDEATSALDSESEQKVQMAIEDLMQGRTILVVAHRLSTIQNASRILVLEHGKVVETGKHNDLLHQGGRYKDLYQLQFMA